jgi:hypothetical protein
MKNSYKIAIVIAVLAVAGGAYFYPHNKSVVQVQENGGTPIAKVSDTQKGLDATTPMGKCPSTYENKQYGFSFKCPSNAGYDAFVPNSPTVGEYVVWIYVDELDANLGKDGPSFTIQVHPSTGDLVDFVKNRQGELAASSGYITKSLRNTTFAGRNDAVMYDYTFVSSGHAQSGNGHVFWVKNGNFFYRIGVGEDLNNPLIKDFLASFTLSK